MPAIGLGAAIQPEVKINGEMEGHLSKCVDYVFYVKDSPWGGQAPVTNHLSPTSAAIVEISASFVVIGGGDVSRDEMLASGKAGKIVTHISAAMNHKIAR